MESIKATALITQLQNAVDEFGDLKVYAYITYTEKTRVLDAADDCLVYLSERWQGEEQYLIIDVS